ncbi:TonB-dependent receptor [Tellurirhabdus rosea]|uniref:TonB-dependent receptor n=1 Tax=Tellurirhabdus rosea TaxID=2674997 RepID=UPI0022501221|nr:TonB-dependent receptor [Tellurirhabdus rosea]
MLVEVWTAFPAEAQPECHCFVKGQVFDNESHQPVPGATIYIKELQKGVLTDQTGTYRLENLCQGTYTLLCRIVGYREVSQQFTLEHTSEQDIYLSEESIHLRDVNVTAQRAEVLNSQNVARLDGRALEQTRGQSLGEALRALPGVTVLQTGASIAKPVIHGMHSNRILILNNGVRQEGQQWGSEHAPEIDPFVARQLTVVRGAAGVRYGSDALGGVILVEPAALPTQPGLEGSLTLAGFSNGQQGAASGQLAGAFGPESRFGWRMQGTLKRGGNLRAPNYFLDNTGSSEQNFSGTFAYRTARFRSELFYSRFATRLGIFSGAHIGSLSDLKAIFENGQPFVQSGFSYAIGRPYQDVQHDLLKVKTVWKPRAGGEWQLVAARQTDDRSEYDLHGPRNDSLRALNRPELRFQLTTYTADLVYEHKPVDGRLSGSLGLSGLYQFNIMSGRPLIPNFRTFTGGLFWIEKYRRENWEVEAGLRYDWRHMQVFRYENRVLTRPTYVFSRVSGTLGFTRYLSDRWTSRVNLGTAWRAPNVSELFSDGVHHGAASYEVGNQTLLPEVAYNLTLGSEYSGKRVKAELGIFVNTIRNYIYLKPQAEPVLTIRGAFPAFQYTQTDALYAGLDADATITIWPKLDLTTRLSYLYVQDLRQQQPLVMIPPNRWDNGLQYDFGKVGRLRNVFVGIGHLWVARQNRVPANSDFVVPPPAYQLWSAKAGATIPISQRQQLEASLTVSNLFNTVYRDYLNRFRYFSDEIGRNVALRVKYSF